LGKKSSKSTTTSTIPGWAQPYAQGAAGAMSDAVNANQPGAQATADAIRGYLPGLGQKAFGDDPTLGAASGYLQDVLGGKYLSQGNPYLQGMIDSTDRSVSDQVNSMFAKSGASLGTQHAGVLGQSLADAENNLRYNNYANERNSMGQAASQAGSNYAAQFAGVNPYMSAAVGGTQIPLMGPQAGLGIGSLWAGQGTTTSTQPGGWLNQLLAAAASGASAGAAASDPELKTNIERIGEWDDRGDGLGRYRWNWKSDPNGEKVEGVLSTEVARLRPAAYVPNFRGDGFDGVNYAKLSEAA
jgi:hypothetical protein